MYKVRSSPRAICTTNVARSAGLQVVHRRPCTHPSKHRTAQNAVQSAAADLQQHKQHAVVLGSGVSGMTAAKVLSKYFTVTVLERDSVSSTWTEEAATDAMKFKGARRGVVQYHHMHIMAGKGLLVLDDLFDGHFITSLRQAGAVLSDVVVSFTNYHPLGQGPWAHPAAGGAKGPVLMGQATRHVFESVTRQLLQGTPGVELVYGASVQGLLLQGGQEQQQQGGQEDGGGSAGSGARIAGVVLSDGRQMSADLVVDCSGRQSHMPQWLAAAGLQGPRVSTVNANLGYASWLVRLDPEVAASTLKGASGLYAIACYPQAVGCALVEVEGGLHMAGLCTYAGQAPPLQDDALLDFVKQRAWHPAAAEALVGSTPVAPASRFYRVASTWRHYEQVALPDGLLVAADAVASFNPIYGHGMSVAALEMAQLDQLLAARRGNAAAPAPAAAGQSGAAAGGGEGVCLAGITQEFQQAITPIVQKVWDLSVGGDQRFATTVSSEPPSAASAAMNAYFDILMELAPTDPEVTEGLLRVTHLIDEASELTTPHMLGKVVRHKLTAPFRRLWGSLRSGGSSSTADEGGAAAGANA